MTRVLPTGAIALAGPAPTPRAAAIHRGVMLGSWMAFLSVSAAAVTFPFMQVRRALALTRYCHNQCCMVPGTQEGVRGGTIHCVIVCAEKIQGGEVKEVFRATNRID